VRFQQAEKRLRLDRLFDQRAYSRRQRLVLGDAFAESAGALVAFIVAATPITVFGITSAFWAIVAGIAASACAERGELAAFWSPRRDGSTAMAEHTVTPHARNGHAPTSSLSHKGAVI